MSSAACMPSSVDPLTPRHTTAPPSRPARRDEFGIYQGGDGLRVLPFGLRFLARRQPPDRWLVGPSSDAEAPIAAEEVDTVMRLKPVDTA